MTDLVQRLNQIKARFQSGNSVQIDKAMVPKAEFDYLIDRIEQLEVGVVEQCNVNRDLRVKLEKLERENAELRNSTLEEVATDLATEIRGMKHD